MEQTQKAVPLNDGKRISIRLDDSTWELIDRIAEQHGQSWREWCASALEKVPDGENVAASLRESVARALLSAVIDFGTRGTDIARMAENRLTRDSGTFSDGQLESFLARATIAGESDFGGFTVLFGQDDYGQDFLVIKNGLRDGSHFATVIGSGK